LRLNKKDPFGLFFLRKNKQALNKSDTLRPDLDKGSIPFSCHEKKLKFIDTEYANFTFLSDEQKRKNYSTLSLLVASRPYEFRRGYATDKQPYNEEMRILYIGASSLLKLYYYKRRERLRLFFRFFSEK
jgi:hypothetical protein